MSPRPLPTPKPVITARTCSVCGLPWDDHGKRPTINKCVELLKAALAAERTKPFYWGSGTTVAPGQPGNPLLIQNACCPSQP